MILPAMAAGGAVGAGLLVALRGVVAPPLPRLDRRLVELYEPRLAPGDSPFQRRWQSWALQLVRSATDDLRPLRRNLAVTGTTMERHAIAKLTFAVLGAALPLGVGLAWTAAGIGAPFAALALVAAFAVVGGFFVPDALLARRAARRRRDFRYALSLFLDLVVIVLAGGGGVETALHDAANSGSGWAFGELRRALNAARLRRTSPWHALRDLGEQFGSADLVELASSVQLAGTSGARVRESLRAKAISARDHELAEAEAEALAASERMGAPMVAMFVGLILLIGYPAMVTVLAL
jgi:Flp pilus assembly protein TadB